MIWNYHQQPKHLSVIFIFILFLALLVLIMLVPFKSSGAELHGYAEIGNDIVNEHWFTEINIDFSFLFLLRHNIYATQTVLFDQEKTSGRPFRDIYTVGYGISHRWFFANIEHWCSHPVISYGNEQYLYRDIFTGNSTKISAGIRW